MCGEGEASEGGAKSLITSLLTPAGADRPSGPRLRLEGLQEGKREGAEVWM